MRTHPTDYIQEHLSEMKVSVKMIGPILEDEGMNVFEYWGGEYHPLEELIAEMDEIKNKNEIKIRQKISKKSVVSRIFDTLFLCHFKLLQFLFGCV